MSSASSIASRIDSVVNQELDDADRALKRGDTEKAKREIGDAISKLRGLANDVRRLGR